MCALLQNVHTLYKGNLKGRDHFGDVEIGGRILLKWILKIRCQGLKWIQAALYGAERRVFVNTVIILRFHARRGIYCTSSWLVTSSRFWTSLDHQRNSDITERLKVTNIVKGTEGYQQKRRNHLERMKRNRLIQLTFLPTETTVEISYNADYRDGDNRTW